MTIKLRYKQPDGNKSALLQQPVNANENSIMSDNFKLAASVAEFGMLLRKSAYKSNASYESARQMASETTGYDKEGYRKELVLTDTKGIAGRREGLDKKK